MNASKRGRRPGILLTLTLVAAGTSACSTDLLLDDDATGGLCAGYDNDPEAPVTFTLENPSAEAIYIVHATSEPVPSFTISDANDEALSTGWSRCSCEEQQVDRHACTHSWGGPSEHITIIPPGGSVDIVWDGRIAEQREMDGACFDDQRNDNSTCRQHLQAPEGIYTFELDVVTGLTGCAGGGGAAEACSCEAGQTHCTSQSFGTSFEQSITLTTLADLSTGRSFTVTYEAG